ncbi:MAG TPA: hypothetical protein VN821_03560, partial [Candidatus Udaeobacter sp.]|nr:hypothetical protein [Candidatus Udaeobacter sp.]
MLAAIRPARINPRPRMVAPLFVWWAAIGWAAVAKRRERPGDAPQASSAECRGEAKNPLIIDPFRPDAASLFTALEQHSGYSKWEGIVVLLRHLRGIMAQTPQE